MTPKKPTSLPRLTEWHSSVLNESIKNRDKFAELSSAGVSEPLQRRELRFDFGVNKGLEPWPIATGRSIVDERENFGEFEDFRYSDPTGTNEQYEAIIEKSLQIGSRRSTCFDLLNRCGYRVLRELPTVCQQPTTSTSCCDSYRRNDQLLRL